MGMNLLQIINTVVVVVGVPTIAGVLISVGKKLKTLEIMEDTIYKMKGNLKVVCDYLARHHNKFDPRELQAYSPLKLTDAGEALVESTGFDNVFETNKADFFSFIDSENVKLKYDVEATAVKSIYTFYDKEYMSFLKVYLYNHPERSIENVAPTLGVYVRDKYLSEHPEITQ